jgi:hypothetical protein
MILAAYVYVCATAFNTEDPKVSAYGSNEGTEDIFGDCDVSAVYQFRLFLVGAMAQLLFKLTDVEYPVGFV